MIRNNVWHLSSLLTLPAFQDTPSLETFQQGPFRFCSLPVLTIDLWLEILGTVEVPEEDGRPTPTLHP